MPKKRSKSNLIIRPSAEIQRRRDAIRFLSLYIQKNQHLSLEEALIKYFYHECEYNFKEMDDDLNLPRNRVFVILETIKRKETEDYEKALMLFLPSYKPRGGFYRKGYDKYDDDEKDFYLRYDRLLESEDTDLIKSKVDQKNNDL